MLTSAGLREAYLCMAGLGLPATCSRAVTAAYTDVASFYCRHCKKLETCCVAPESVLLCPNGLPDGRDMTGSGALQLTFATRPGAINTLAAQPMPTVQLIAST